MQYDFLNEVTHQWYDPLYKFAYSLARNPDDALDLTQNAFHKLATKGQNLREKSKVKSWLFSVVHREFIDQYRRRQRYPNTPLEFAPEPRTSENASPGRGLDRQRAIQTLAQMEEKFRAPLTLFYLEQFSYREIAEVLGIPIGTVMSRLRRAKNHLRKELEETDQSTPNKTITFPSHG
ncbi:MAG: RNA polymerase sigma factor [Opitutales bacterium]|nr:RNA polymerase sigma factor [Opitutales bacterium]MCH8539740.1 RNA polymerase sigma factor [Opitutales bacterium]